MSLPSSAARMSNTSLTRALVRSSPWVTSHTGTGIPGQSGSSLTSSGVRIAKARRIIPAPSPRRTSSHRTMAFAQKRRGTDHGTAECPLSPAHRGTIDGVEGEQLDSPEFLGHEGLSIPGDPAVRGIEIGPHVADLPGDQLRLRRAKMTNGNVGFAAPQIADRIGSEDRESDLRCLLPDALDDVGQDIGGEDIGGGDADPTRHFRCLASGRQHHRFRRYCHRAGVIEQAAARLGQHKLLSDPLEQSDAELRLQLGYLPREGRLRQTKPAGGGGQGARISGRAKGAGTVPVDDLHARMYMSSAPVTECMLSRIW